MIPEKYCHTLTLRLVPYICSVINFLLIYEIKSLILFEPGNRNKHDVLLETLALATLPPMYFFSHVYYTDTPSITMVLFMLLLSFKKCHKSSVIFAALSVLMRQTNIVWVAGTLGVLLVDKMMANVYPKMRRENATFGNFLFAMKTHLKDPKMFMKFLLSSFVNFFGYFLVILAFIVFLFMNGSIVVGDKSAHEASIHVPQLFYFTLFVLIFGSSMWIPHVFDVFKIFKKWKYLLSVIFLGIVIAMIVKYNTLIHPYLLADNRHFTFYIWNRFYGRYALARFLIIPVYIFGLYTIFKSMNGGSIGFKIFYVISTLMTVCLQKMIEVRYFLIPFLLLRINRSYVVKKWSFLELCGNLCINYFAFKVFFNVEIKWSDFEDIQRIIW